jgi:hypothetical protein
LDLPASSEVVDKPVDIELDQAKREIPGSEIGAGLFTRR